VPRPRKPGTAFRWLFFHYQFEAKRTGRIFELTEAEFKTLTQKDCHYCGAPPAQRLPKEKEIYIYNGVDRLYSDRGYTKDNCVAACGICNRMKGTLTPIEFLDKVRAIAEHSS
jgi:hypothetical protein